MTPSSSPSATERLVLRPLPGETYARAIFICRIAYGPGLRTCLLDIRGGRQQYLRSQSSLGQYVSFLGRGEGVLWKEG